MSTFGLKRRRRSPSPTRRRPKLLSILLGVLTSVVLVGSAAFGVIQVENWIDAPLNIEWDSPQRLVGVVRAVPELIVIRIDNEVQDSIIVRSAALRETSVGNMHLRLKQAFLHSDLAASFKAVVLGDVEPSNVSCLQLTWVSVGLTREPPDAVRYTVELFATLRRNGVVLAKIRKKVVSDEAFRKRSEATLAFTNALEKVVEATSSEVLANISSHP